MEYEPRDIRQIKLVSGEEILAEVTGEDMNEILIANPLKVGKEKFTFDGRTAEANFFSRWMAFADTQEFVLHKQNIVVEAIVDDAVADHYNTMVSNISNKIHLSGVVEGDDSEFTDSEELDDSGYIPTYH